MATVGRIGPSRVTVATAAVLIVAVCGGGALALSLLHAQGPLLTAASAAPSHSPSPSPQQSPPSRGQCVVNDGSDDAPRLRAVACGPGSFQVVARFDGTTDVRRCVGAAGATHDYFYDTTPDSHDFVLCLKKQ